MAITCLRACANNAVLRMYEKFSTCLRLEVLSNNLKDFGLKKSLDNLETVRQTLATVSDRFAEFEAQALDVHVDFPLFQRLALPIPSGNTKIPGIQIQDTRMLRLMEVLLHRGTQLGGWRSRQIHEAILSAFQLTPENYTLTQFRYDLRKLKAHGLLERNAHHYAYRLTDKGIRVALMFILFHQRVCGPWPIAYSTDNPPNSTRQPANSKPHIRKPTLLFRKPLTYLPLEVLRDKFSDLTFKNLLEVNIHDAKIQLSRLLARVALGQEVVSPSGEAVAKLVRLDDQSESQVPS